MSGATRRQFVGGMAAVGASATVDVLVGRNNATAGTVAEHSAFHVPDGAEFAGMAGAYAALVTPYKADGSVNEDMIEQLVAHGLENGLRGFYLTGSTGEGFLLSSDERVRVYECAAKAARGRAKLIAHVGCISTEESVKLARRAAKAGVDWVSSVAPVYFGQNFDAAFAHYSAIAGATDLPFMIYSVGAQVVPDRDVRFFEIPNVKGMKYTGYAYWTVKQLRRRLPKPAIFFAGAASDRAPCAHLRAGGGRALCRGPAPDGRSRAVRGSCGLRPERLVLEERHALHRARLRPRAFAGRAAARRGGIPVVRRKGRGARFYREEGSCIAGFHIGL